MIVFCLGPPPKRVICITQSYMLPLDWSFSFFSCIWNFIMVPSHQLLFPPFRKCNKWYFKDLVLICSKAILTLSPHFGNECDLDSHVFLTSSKLWARLQGWCGQHPIYGVPSTVSLSHSINTYVNTNNFQCHCHHFMFTLPHGKYFNPKRLFDKVRPLDVLNDAYMSPAFA